MKIALILSALGAVCLTFAAGACGDATTDDPSASMIPGDGLGVVEMDEASGKLVLKFEKEGHAITYDMRLGPKMLTPPSDEDLALDPELPTYEVDAQVLDANEQPFLMQMGGDSFIDASWRMPRVENFYEERRLADIRLIRDAVPAFRQLKIPASLDQLRLAAIQIGLGLDDVSEEPELWVPTPTEELAPGEVDPPEGAVTPRTKVTGTSTVAKWNFRVRKVDLKVLGIKVGDHSAVHLRGLSSSNSVVFNSYSCNHGTCAGSTSMGTHCTSVNKTDDGTHSRRFYREGSTSQGSVTGGCTTSYSWASGSSRHNCNDDSELQAKSAFHNSTYSTTGGSCGTSGLHNYAPGCSY